uniref:DNA recombination protein RmuC n=2 Tax=Aromatoleum anaerobium TaxID=182180 RepID=A0ABX1PUV5_9RHOO
MVTTLERVSCAMTEALNAQLKHFSDQITSLNTSLGERLDGMRTESTNGAKLLREEVATNLKGIATSLSETMGQLSSLQKSQLEAMATAIDKLSQSVDAKLEAVRTTVDGKLKSMQEDNAKQIEQMRLTVDEKLQGTLEKRLSESFKHVSDRLELVHKGLGEMQTLATGVGDLKKVLTNVKTRGTWGEVQLGALLEQVLTPEQYGSNVATNGGSERVEFAIKLPGQGDSRDQTVWLPLDAKFPVEDYQRLLDAQERADVEAVEAAGKQLETRVKQCARDISTKYLSPPATTDFGILFLPIEGLFAEVIRRPGLTEALQRDQRVVIAGPTTLWSILSSLQMGFRTLAIQKRSSEVWNLLGAIKTEWAKYSDVLDLVQKKLHQASETIDKAQVRTRAVSRKLRGVEALPAAEAAALLPFEVAGGEDDLEDREPDPVSVLVPV